ncbi:MAG: DNA primase [Chitinophagaceae bacterium]|nr:MAG: DNA primase [Chitinophagaceae bacterium]
MISQDTIQQVQTRIDIVDIIGSFVKLKRRGANYLGLCPFHNERTPSFTVSPSKEIYKCFGCGRSGNAIGFLMEHEKYSFVEAIKWLAQKYGIEVEETEASPEIAAQRQLADSLYIVNQFAQQYFSEALFNTVEGQDIGISYFKERGFTEETVRKFQLGYCLDTQDSFSSAALKKGYQAEYLQKAGLMVMRNERPADNYRGRVIFPIHNQSGKVVGFGARVLKKTEKSPKYINTPENEIYIKSKILYGTYFARHAIDKENECLLVEGYTDVISLHQAGLENVVASSGTSLTHDQLRLIKKYTNNLTILYDGDAAGVKAALRGLDMALEESLNVQLVLLPGEEDPDSFVQKVGAEAFKEYILENKKDFILFKLQLSLKDAAHDPVKKSALVNEIAETLAKINKAEDFTRQQDYIRECSNVLQIDEQGLTSLVNKYIRQQLEKTNRLPVTENKQLEEAAAAREQAGQDEAIEFLLDQELQEKNLVRILLEYGNRSWDETCSIADYIFNSPVNFNLLHNEAIKNILSAYKRLSEQGQAPDKKLFLYHEDPEISRLTASALYTAYEVSVNWEKSYRIVVPGEEQVFRQDAGSVIHYLLQKMILRFIRENTESLKEEKDPVEQNKLMKTNNELVNYMKEIFAKTGTVIRK